MSHPALKLLRFRFTGKQDNVIKATLANAECSLSRVTYGFYTKNMRRNGYTCTKTHNYLGSDGEYHAKVHTYWTQKGRLFIYELLKSHGYLPLIEQGLEFEVM